MMKIKWIASLILLGWMSLNTAFADTFTIKHIDVNGLQRISSGTVYRYLPVKVGSQLDTEKTNNIIQSLYATGFFSDVSLARQGNTLIVTVVERPVIGNIALKGNHAIKTKQLMDALAKLDFQEGSVYNQSLSEKIKIGLEEQYYNLGYYDATVDVVAEPQKRGRVAVHINIHEGSLAIVRGINIIGNHAFSDKTLIKQMSLTTPGVMTWLTHSDRYSREKFQADMQTITSYYMDRGYAEFRVDSATAQVSPDKGSVYLTVHVTEGPLFTISGYKIEGKSAVAESELEKNIIVAKGDIFSRKNIVRAEDSIKEALGEKGYAFANVQTAPKIDEKNHTVFLTFTIDEGKVMYVRHIQFVGNTGTNDTTLRSRMAQLEGGVINTSHVKQSKRQLNQLPYIRNVDIKTDPVAGTDDKVDLDVSMDAVAPAQVQAGVGYSESDGIVLNAGVTHKDVLGTGKSVSLNLVHSSYIQNYSFTYVNPYYTTNGISRGFTAYARLVDPSSANISSDYSYDQYGGRVFYNIPMDASEHSNTSINLGYGLNSTHLDVSDEASTQVKSFVDDYGEEFYELSLTAGWVHNALNRYIFPTRGYQHSVGANVNLPLTSDSLGYAKVNYNTVGYLPLGHDFIVEAKGQLGYGFGFIRSDDLPFYANYYAGGIGTVRGYQANTLGPLDSNGDPYGGNFIMTGTVGLIFPNFISPDNLRTTWFFDAGNVFDLQDQATTGGGFSTGDIRYSTGLDVKWLSPIGVLQFSLATALNESSSDTTQVFEFQIGTSF